jgi:hypothetical protein
MQRHETIVETIVMLSPSRAPSSEERQVGADYWTERVCSDLFTFMRDDDVLS